LLVRVTAVITLALVLSSAAARAQNDDTRDLPSPSAAGRSSPPPERDIPRERARADRAPAHGDCSAEWICGRIRLRANDNYPLGSNLSGLHAGGRWIDGPCRKEKRC
jgi:hypothetical protein